MRGSVPSTSPVLTTSPQMATFPTAFLPLAVLSPKPHPAPDPALPSVAFQKYWALTTSGDLPGPEIGVYIPLLSLRLNEKPSSIL